MREYIPKPQRVRVPTDNPEVSVYKFTGTDADVPEQVRDALEVYLEARERKIDPLERAKPDSADAAEKVLKMYARKQVLDKHMSVIRHSRAAEKGPWKAGTDSRVFTHNTDRYVFKYSVLGHKASPEMTQYYRRKYALLKHIGLAEHIPQSAFFFGETRRPFDAKNPRESVFPHEVAITIQRRIPGKTFAEMTSAERSQPEVVTALREAMGKYVRAKRIVERANAALKKRGVGVDIALNLGNVSDKTELSNDFIARRCTSPNIIYNKDQKRVYFIDFDYGTWSSDKEEVFRYLMDQPPVGKEDVEKQAA